MMSRKASPGRYSGVPPVFVLDSSLLTSDGKAVSGLDLCIAAERVAGVGQIDGSQRIGKVWRIYPSSTHARQKLLIHGINFNSQAITLLSQNPKSVANPGVPVTKLLISGLETSISNKDIEQQLLDMKVKLCSSIKMAHYRYPDGSLSAFKSGKRFVYIELPESSLPLSIKIADRWASLYYKEQIRPQHQSSPRSRQENQVASQSNDAPWGGSDTEEEDTQNQSSCGTETHMRKSTDETDVLTQSDKTPTPVNSNYNPPNEPNTLSCRTTFSEKVQGSPERTRSRGRERVRNPKTKRRADSKQTKISKFIPNVGEGSDTQNSSRTRKRSLDTTDEQILPSGKVTRQYEEGETDAMLDWFDNYAESTTVPE